MSTDVELIDLLVHVDEQLGAEKREAVTNKLLDSEGVIAAGFHNETPHLLFVVFNPKNLASIDVLNLVKATGVHAELTGG